MIDAVVAKELLSIYHMNLPLWRGAQMGFPRPRNGYKCSLANENWKATGINFQDYNGCWRPRYISRDVAVPKSQLRQSLAAIAIDRK